MYAEIFRAPCWKNYALDQKMIAPFLVVSTSSITVQNLGKIVQRAPAVGAQKVVFVFFCTCRYCFYSVAKNQHFAP